MRKLYSLLLVAFIFCAFSSSAGTVHSTAVTSTFVASSKTPVGMMVQGFFRKIFTGKEQMSEKKRKRILARQK